MKSVQKPIFGTSAKLRVIKLAGDLLRSTNVCTIDLDQKNNFKFLFCLAHGEDVLDYIIVPTYKLVRTTKHQLKDK
ncbi:MAG: hypothetical protein ACI9N3_001396 [Colwellia sp.]|jgi:hypothetical protein